MLGQKYTVAEKFEKDFESLIWCSYRKNFPRLIGKLPAEEVGAFTNDTSWGCMIRATQMMFCEVLKRKLTNAKKFESGYHLLKGIISWIVDGENAESGVPYSIQTICEEVYTHSKIKPGSWFKAAEIMLSLQRIHRANHTKTVENLDIAVFLEGTIYLDQILNLACAEPTYEDFIDVSAEEAELGIKEHEETKAQTLGDKKCRSKTNLSEGSFEDCAKSHKKKPEFNFVDVSFEENSKDFEDS